MSQVLIEVACFTPESALKAVSNGAGRIELCSGYSEGGLSPSAGTISLVRNKVDIPIHVMVRPRVGDFLYNSTDMEAIFREVSFYRELGVDGIVVGILTSDGHVDTKAIAQIVEKASPMTVTFHRAFDQCTDLKDELLRLIDCGVHRVLTSGGKADVISGLDNLKKLVEIAENKIIVLPGGGIRADNVQQIVQRLGVPEIHLSAKALVNSRIENVNENLSLCDPNGLHDFSWYECDGLKVSEVSQLLNKT